MNLTTRHILWAGSAAIAIHLAVFAAFKSQVFGEASPPPGPKIEMATSLAGVIGAEVQEVEDVTPDVVESIDAEPIEETERPPMVAAAEPIVTPQNLPDLEVVPTVEQKEEPKKVEDVKPVAEPLKKKKKLKPKKKKRKTAKKKTKKKRKAKKASKSGNTKKGNAGLKKGGGGKSRASAGAISNYASRVRARVLSRRPGSAGARGTTVISFGVSTSGGLRYARISRSSGNKGLDSKALSAVRRASPFPKPPSGARTSQLRFSVPFYFR